MADPSHGSVVRLVNSPNNLVMVQDRIQLGDCPISCQTRWRGILSECGSHTDQNIKYSVTIT